MIESVIFITAFISLYAVFYTGLKYAYRNKQVISVRLDKISKESSREEASELNQPLFVRIIRPVLDDISKIVLRVTPKEVVAAYEKKVILAGRPFDLSVKDWINLQVMIILCLPLGAIAIGYAINAEVRNIVFISITGVCLGMVLPRLVLSKKMTARQKEIIGALPDVLDLLTVSVEAGLGFDGALAKVIDKMPGPLANEFDNVLQEIKVGKQKKDALKDMADRVGNHDLTTFVSSIIQADQFGVSIGHVLRIQSEQMRQKRRQRAQEKAMKAPVKMLIPMVLFIFPTIFSVLIGPVIIRVVDVFMQQ